MESTMARIVCCVTWPDNVYRTPSATNTAAHSGFRSLAAWRRIHQQVHRMAPGGSECVRISIIAQIIRVKGLLRLI